MGGGADFPRLVRDTADGMRDVTEYVARSNDEWQKASETVNGMNVNFNQMIINLNVYGDIVKNMQNVFAQELNIHKDINSELEKKKSTTRELADNSNKHIEETGRKIEQTIKSPVESLLKMLTKELPGLGPALAIMQAGAKEYRSWETPAREAGLGIEAYGGAGNIMSLGVERELSSRLGFASKEESMGALGKLMGSGGLRGDELEKTFSGLAESAHNAGMKLNDMADVAVVMARMFSMGSVDIKDSIREMTKMARDKSYDPEQYIKTVMGAATATAAYGVGVDQVSFVMQDLYQQVLDGKIKQGELNEAVVKHAQSTGGLIGVNLLFEKSVELAKDGLVSLNAQLKLEGQIADTLMPYRKNREVAERDAQTATVGLQKAIDEGRVSFGTLQAILPDLVSTFKAPTAYATVLAERMDTLGKEVGVAGPELAKGMMGVAKTLVEQGEPTKSSLALGETVMRTFAKNFRDLDITIPQVTEMFSTMRQTYDMTNTEVIQFTHGLIKAHAELKIPTDELIKWQGQISSGLVDMFGSSKEAAMAGVFAVAKFGEAIEQGKMSASDVTKIIRTQMDVFGESGPKALSRVDAFADAVQNSSIRMEEFGKFISESSKVMKRYGVDQTEGLELFKGFNQYIRDGSMSMSEFNDLIKGPAGASDPMKAMIFERLSGMGGATGEAFGKAGVLGSIDVLIPAIAQAARPGGRSTEALRQAFGGEQDWAAIQTQVQGAFRGTAQDLFNTVGGTGNLAGAQGAMSRLSPLLGANFRGATPEALEALLNTYMTGQGPAVTAVADKDATNKELISSYKSFNDSVKIFDKAVASISKKSNVSSTSNDLPIMIDFTKVTSAPSRQNTIMEIAQNNRR